jgi:hypothetical protein
MMNDYTVNGNGFETFKAAVAFASACRGEVLEAATGIVRWTPAPAVSAAKVRRYEQQKAAYAAYKATR